MTPFRFRACLRYLRWGLSDAAKAMNVKPIQARRWSSGKEPLPAEFAEWLERLVAFHEQNPAPVLRKEQQISALSRSAA